MNERGTLNNIYVYVDMALLRLAALGQLPPHTLLMQCNSDSVTLSAVLRKYCTSTPKKSKKLVLLEEYVRDLPAWQTQSLSVMSRFMEM